MTATIDTATNSIFTLAFDRKEAAENARILHGKALVAPREFREKLRFAKAERAKQFRRRSESRPNLVTGLIRADDRPLADGAKPPFYSSLYSPKNTPRDEDSVDVRESKRLARHAEIKHYCEHGDYHGRCYFMFDPNYVDAHEARPNDSYGYCHRVWRLLTAWLRVQAYAKHERPKYREGYGIVDDKSYDQSVARQQKVLARELAALAFEVARDSSLRRDRKGVVSHADWLKEDVRRRELQAEVILAWIQAGGSPRWNGGRPTYEAVAAVV